MYQHKENRGARKRNYDYGYLRERLRWAEGLLQIVLKIAKEGLKDSNFSQLALRNIIYNVETYMEAHFSRSKKEEEGGR